MAHDINEPSSTLQEMYRIQSERDAFSGEYQITVTGRDIYDFVSGDISEPQEIKRINQAIETNSALRDLYREILGRKRSLFIPVATAASTENTISKRQVENCAIKVIPSKHKSDTSYVIVEIDKGYAKMEGHRLIMHALSDTVCESIIFQNIHDGKAQIILENDDPFLLAVTNEQTEISVIFEQT